MAVVTRSRRETDTRGDERPVARRVRIALLSQGLLYLAAATISTVDVKLFLLLTHRPGVNAFQTQVSGLLYGAIGLVVLLAGLMERPPPAAVAVGCAGAVVTAVLEAVYLPYWSFYAHPRFTSSLWVDLPYEAALAIILAPTAWRWARGATWLRWDRAALRELALPVVAISVVIALGGVAIYLLAR